MVSWQLFQAGIVRIPDVRLDVLCEPGLDAGGVVALLALVLGVARVQVEVGLEQGRVAEALAALVAHLQKKTSQWSLKKSASKNMIHSVLKN